MDYEKLWNGMMMYVDEMKEFAENLDTKGNENAEMYKEGLKTAFEGISETAEGLIEIHSMKQ